MPRHSTTTKRHKSQRVDGKLKETIEILAFRRWKAPAIHAELLKEFGKGRTPNLRTIQRWVNKITPEDPTGPWRLADADDPDDAALVVPVIATVGKEVLRWALTKREAEWVVRIRKAAPELPIIAVPQVVWTYMVWEQSEWPTELLDLVLSARPWRSLTTREALDRALAEGGDPGQDAITLVGRIVSLDAAARLHAITQDVKDKRKGQDSLDLAAEEVKERKENNGT